MTSCSGYMTRYPAAPTLTSLTLYGQGLKLSTLQTVLISSCVSQCVVMLSQDSFYRGLSPEELADVACEPALSRDQHPAV